MDLLYLFQRWHPQKNDPRRGIAVTQNSMDMRERGLASVVEHCQQEQRSHRSDTPIDSPWCVEIFRRAFHGDQDAWVAIWEQFQRHMLLWARAGTVDVEDVVQDGFANFARGAP